MKKLAILTFSALFLLGVTGCGSEKGSNSGTDSTGTAPVAVPVNGENPATTDPNVSTADPATPTLPPTTVQFNTMSHDFGKIKEGEVVSHKFMFKNTGDKPLLVENVKPSCGCTTPDWTKEEVAPGKEGFVAVEFNSAGKSGQQTKTVNVTLNTAERNVVLTFSGEVVK